LGQPKGPDSLVAVSRTLESCLQTDLPLSHRRSSAKGRIWEAETEGAEHDTAPSCGAYVQGEGD
jgi:hypothetical protein